MAEIIIDDIILINNVDNLFIINPDKTITLNTDIPGTYSVDYKIRQIVEGSECSEILYSNIGRITVNILPDCNFTIEINENL